MGVLGTQKAGGETSPSPEGGQNTLSSGRSIPVSENPVAEADEPSPPNSGVPSSSIAEGTEEVKESNPIPRAFYQRHSLSALKTVSSGRAPGSRTGSNGGP